MIGFNFLARNIFRKRPCSMAKKNQIPFSKRFLVSPSMNRYREIYPDGDWLIINDELALSGWGPLLRERIHAHLRVGLPLSLAVRQVAEGVGRCPINSKSFF